MPQTSNKTILNVLLEKNRLTETEAIRFPKEASNAEIEKILREENLVSSEDIAKAYAVVYDLPFIRLVNYPIQAEAFELIPLSVAQKYQILAFERDQNKVKIALASPANLKSNPPTIIQELKDKKGITIDLYITDQADIQAAIQKFANPGVATIEINNPSKINTAAPGAKTMNLPAANLKSGPISYDIISKFPIEISKKYKMVVFANPAPNLIKVAVANPFDPKVQEILDFVRQKNEIAIEEFSASPQEIDEAIKLYYRKPITPPEKSIEAKMPESKEEVPRVSASPQPSAFPAEPVKIKPIFLSEKSKAKEEERPSIHFAMAKREDEHLARPEFNRRPEPNAVETPEEDETDEEVTTVAPESDLDTFLGQEVKDVETLTKIAETGNIPYILAATVALAVMKKASDIHIEPEGADLRIRFRIDGVLKDVIKMPLDFQAAIISRIKILSRLKIDEQRIPQDGRFDVKTHGHEIDLRVSTLPTVKGEKAALRILDKTQNIYSLDELGIAGRNLKVLEENIIKPYGVILATGPTGSGKSTTLYSILKKISSPKVNVITLEDPVEYEIPGINQCQVKPKIGFTFADGLRSVLRQDPNIIMVGEIRDAETANMATQAALTGHLVLSTLHTNDAAGALPRLINMGIEPFLITSSMNAVIGQRLVRKICQHCKHEFNLPAELAKDVEKELAKFNLPQPYKFYEGAGCPECNQGYSGRIGIYEILSMSEKVETLVVQRRPASEIAAAAVSEGMVTMKQDGLLKALKGITSVSEVLRVTMKE